MNGIMLGEHVLVTDEAGSKPIVEKPEPEAPDGYRSDYSWVDTGSAIEQSWRLVPEEGSAAEAAVELARIQARSLSDADAELQSRFSPALGRRAAEDVKKRHAILSRFLTQVLGVNPKIADMDACKMEHAVSRETLEKLHDYLHKQTGEKE